MKVTRKIAEPIQVFGAELVLVPGGTLQEAHYKPVAQLQFSITLTLEGEAHVPPSGPRYAWTAQIEQEFRTAAAAMIEAEIQRVSAVFATI